MFREQKPSPQQWGVLEEKIAELTLEQGYLYRHIYSKADLTNGDSMKLACTLHWFKTRMTCLGITGVVLPRCNPIRLMWSSKPRDRQDCQAFSNMDGSMYISALFLLSFLKYLSKAQLHGASWVRLNLQDLLWQKSL